MGDKDEAQTFSRPLAFATGVVCLASLLAYLGRWSWACDLLVNFRLHYAMLLTLALMAATAMRRWPLAGIAGIGIALNVLPMYGAFFAPPAPNVSNARALRVVAFNVNISNGNLPGIASYLDSLAADVVVLEELSTASAEQLAALLPRLPHRYAAETIGAWGIVILSRWPLIAPQSVSGGGRKYAGRVDVDLGDRRLRLYGAHLNWPLVPVSANIRNEQLADLGEALSACPFACVAVGDFNVTPWSSHFRDSIATPDVHDCAAGRGLLGTWPSGLPVAMRIRIDQCLFAGAVSVAGVGVGEDIGSDHVATINDLLIGGGTAQPGP